jgi:hypothetical protein
MSSDDSQPTAATRSTTELSLPLPNNLSERMCRSLREMEVAMNDIVIETSTDLDPPWF